MVLIFYRDTLNIIQLSVFGFDAPWTNGAAGDHGNGDGDGDGDGDHSVHGAPGSWCRWCRLELTMEGVVAILSFTTGPQAYVTYYCCWSKSAILGQKFIFLIYCVTKPMVKICA